MFGTHFATPEYQEYLHKRGMIIGMYKTKMKQASSKDELLELKDDQANDLRKLEEAYTGIFDK